jgi:DNA polymerase-1
MVRGYAERNAVNAPIQGSAADIIKMAMIKIHQAMKKSTLQSRMILQVHDELVFDVVHTEVDAMKQLVRECMENAVEIAVPLEVEIEVGHNWLDAH